MDQFEIEEISEYTPNIAEKIPPSYMKGNSFAPTKIPEPRISLFKEAEDNKIKSNQDPSPRAKIKKYIFSRKTFKIARTLGKGSINQETLLKPPKLIKNPFIIAKIIRNSTNKILEFYKKKKLYQSHSNVGCFHYALIADKGSFCEKNENEKKKKIAAFSSEAKLLKFIDTLYRVYSKSVLKAYLNKCKKFIRKHFPTINSSSRPKILWDAIVLCFCFLSVLWYSIQKSFIPEDNLHLSQNIMTCYLILLIILYIDIGIILNTDYYHDGIQIKNRYKIFRRFFTTNYFTDVTPCLCLSLFYFFNENEIFFNFSVFVVLKLIKLGELAERAKSILIHNDQAESLYKLIALLLTIFLWGHVLACLWHFIATKNSLSDSYEINWLKAKNIELAPWTTKYLYSFYWAFTTMLTVGYGDVIPTNNAEMFFNIWAMFFGCGMFGYSMNSIGDILKFSGRKTRVLKEQMERVDNMMRDKNLPHETQIKVKKYLEFVWKQEQREDPEYEKLVMGKLSSTLRDEINYFTNVKFLKSVPSFKVFSDKTLIQLANHLQKVRFSPEEFVYKEGDYEDLNIYFVVDGNLGLVSKKGGKGLITWKNYKKGDFIGVQELFSGKARSFSIISLDFSTLFQMSRKDFLNVLSNNYEDFVIQNQKTFKNYLKDQDLVYNEKSQYHIKCQSCGYKDHCESECTFLKYNPNKLFLIGRYNFKKRRFEKNFKRRKKKRVNSLYTKKLNTEDLAHFQDLYSDDDDFNELQEMYENIANDEEEQDIPEKKTQKRESFLDEFDEKPKKSEEAGKLRQDPNSRRRSTREFSFNLLKGNQRKRLSKALNDLLLPEENEGPKMSSKKRVSKVINDLISHNTILEEENDTEASSKMYIKSFSSQKTIRSHTNLPKVTSGAAPPPVEKPVAEKIPVGKIEEGLIFDKLRTFRYYFPRNNVEMVANRTNIIRFGQSEEDKQMQVLPIVHQPSIYPRVHIRNEGNNHPQLGDSDKNSFHKHSAYLQEISFDPFQSNIEDNSKKKENLISQFSSDNIK